MVHYRRFVVQLAATGMLAVIGIMIAAYLTHRVLVIDRRSARQDAAEAATQQALEEIIRTQRVMLDRLERLEAR